MIDPCCLFDVLNEKTDISILLEWILGDVNESVLPGLRRSDFALYFLGYLQEQTTSIIESCSSAKKDDSDSTKQEQKRNYENADNSVDKRRQTGGFARKIFPSPSDKSVSQSIKRVVPQLSNPNQHNNLMIGCSPRSEFQNVSGQGNFSAAPMIYNPQLGYNVPYYGNQNYSNFQTNVPHFSQNTFSNNSFYSSNGGNNIQNAFNNSRNSLSPSSSQLYGAVNVHKSPNFSPNKAEHDLFQRAHTSSSSPQKKGFVTPKTPKSNKLSEQQKRTPNSDSSCSSGISLLSPESPSYHENFPSMSGSNERRAHHEQPHNSNDNCDYQSKKPMNSRKRIKPTLVPKTSGNSTFQDFSKDLKTLTNSISTKVPEKKFPERKKDFFKDEKFLSNREKLSTKTKTDDTVVRKSSIDSKDCDTVDREVSEVNCASLQSSVSCKTISSNIKKGEKSNKSPVKSKTVKDCNVTKQSRQNTLDPSKVKFKSHLNKLADIYSALLDANLIPNITAEIYFIFSLLTVENTITKNKCNSKTNIIDSQRNGIVKSVKINDDDVFMNTEPNSLGQSDKLLESGCTELSCSEVSELTERLKVNDESVEKVDVNLQLFYDAHQCVYFACIVLSKQRHLLEILDKATLKLLIENNKLFTFKPDVVDHLIDLYGKKNKESRNQSRTSLVKIETAINPVPFQMEIDNRDTFSADTSFHIFRKQRDALYDILQIWNEKRDKPNWHFSQLVSKVEKLFTMSADPVNMRHLARHFCDLLLKSVNAAGVETEDYCISGMPEIDKSKLSRLAERLVRPSLSARQKDPRPSPDFPNLQAFYRDFLIVPAAHYSFHTHVINCLTERIHLLNDTSFQFEEPDVNNGQMVQEETRCAFLQCLRSLCVLAKFLGLVVFHPYQCVSDLPQSVLQDEIITRNKVLPPLDLHHYLVVAQDEGRLVQTVPWIVEYLGMMDNAAPHLTYYQTVLNTLFSLYLCTAPHLADSLMYFSRPNLVQVNSGDSVDSRAANNRLKKKPCKLSRQTAILLRLTIGWLFDTSNFSQSLFFNMASSYEKGHHQLEDISDEKWHNITVDSSDIVDEKLLEEFCPYLINLRVCLIKHKNNKQGPVRHITPVPSHSSMSSSDVVAATTTLELQLEENFFMGQSESLKRTVDFVAERVASACIKNICSNGIVSVKHKVLELKANNEKVDYQAYIEKYNECVRAEIENGVSQRLNVALSVLLGPDVMDQSVNKICQQIAARKLQERVVNWLQSHINISEILTKLSSDGGAKTEIDSFSNNHSKNLPEGTLLPSEALIKLQDLLNDTIDSKGKEGITCSTDIIRLFDKLKGTIYILGDNTLNIRLILSLVLDYILLVVTHRPEVISDSVLQGFCALWKLWSNPGPLTRLMSQRNIMLLVQGCLSNPAGWDKFGKLVVAVLKHDLMSISDLELQAVAFFRYNWPEDVLQSMSKCLRSILDEVRKHNSCVNDPKFVMMLELCSEMASYINDGLDEIY